MLIIITGRRGYGKTTLAVRLALRISRRKRLERLAWAPNGLPRKVAGSFKMLPQLREVESARSAVVLIDDASVELMGALTQSAVREAAVSARHRELILIFVFHNVAQIPPFLISLANYMFFFAITDRDEALRAKLGTHPTLYAAAQRALRLERYQWVGVDLDTGKLIRAQL